jgi:hypothetical protein
MQSNNPGSAQQQRGTGAFSLRSLQPHQLRAILAERFQIYISETENDTNKLVQLIEQKFYDAETNAALDDLNGLKW